MKAVGGGSGGDEAPAVEGGDVEDALAALAGFLVEAAQARQFGRGELAGQVVGQGVPFDTVFGLAGGMGPFAAQHTGMDFHQPGAVEEGGQGAAYLGVGTLGAQGFRLEGAKGAQGFGVVHPPAVVRLGEGDHRAAGAGDPAHLAQGLEGIGQPHQQEVAESGLKARSGEGQGQAVGAHRQVIRVDGAGPG